MAALATEFEFTLPLGYVDPEGNLHKHGTMRLATAMDEIAPLRDLRVRSNEAYLVVVLLARVITRLGTITDVTTRQVEGLFAGDLAYLQQLYRQINETGTAHVAVTCSQCHTEFEVDFSSLEGSSATP